MRYVNGIGVEVMYRKQTKVCDLTKHIMITHQPSYGNVSFFRKPAPKRYYEDKPISSYHISSSHISSYHKSLHIIHHCLCCSFSWCPFGPGVAAGAGEAIRDAGERHHLPGVFTLKDAAVRMLEDDESHPPIGCCGIVMLNSD